MCDDNVRLEELLRELLWEFTGLARRFEDAANRLAEEGRRIDLDRAEKAREARHANRRPC
jgi:hypothetical protein